MTVTCIHTRTLVVLLGIIRLIYRGPTSYSFSFDPDEERSATLRATATRPPSHGVTGEP
jgi:hypothetical protein